MQAMHRLRVIILLAALPALAALQPRTVRLRRERAVAGATGRTDRRNAAVRGGAAPAARPTPPPVNMDGRWRLAAQGGSTCSLNFGAAAGAGEGTIAPEGGCPGNFFTSRKWIFAQGGLTIQDHTGQPLAQLVLDRVDPVRRPGQQRAGDLARAVASMAEYQLYCFAQSGNAYRVALMLNLVGADWQPIFVDFFNGETRTPAYREKINEMGEVPGAGAWRAQAVAVRRDPQLSRRAFRQIPAAERGRAPRSHALDHLRQPEGQRLSGPLSVLEDACQSAGKAGRAGIPQGPHRQ